MNVDVLVFVLSTSAVFFGMIGAVVWEAISNNRKNKEFKKYKEELHNVLERKNP